MELLKNLILKEGKLIDNKIIKVDNFLNHQIDPSLMVEIGKEFKKQFSNLNITKILTIEASGIAISLPTAYEFSVPMVFAKKAKPKTMDEFYTTRVKSFTKGVEYDICVSKEYLSPNDNVLIIDDFLAMGAAAFGLKDIVDQSGATLAGIGIVIEKGFQDGGKLLREQGINLKSLAVIDRFENDTVIFRGGNNEKK